MRRDKVLLSLALALLFTGSCAEDPRAADKLQVVAEIDGASITREALGAHLVRHGIARTKGAEARKLVAVGTLDKMIEEALLLKEAKARGIVIEDWRLDREIESAQAGYAPGAFPRTLHAERLTHEDYRKLVRKRLMVSAFLREEMSQLKEPSDDEVRALYESTVAGKNIPDKARVRQVLVKTREEAEHVLSEIRARRLSFEKAAVQHSEAPEGKSGGDLGWFAKGAMPRVFDICFTQKKGAITDVVESDWGFHIFQIVDVAKAHEETFEEAEDRLIKTLKLERQTKAHDALMKRLREKSKLTINKKALDHVVKAIPAPPKEEDFSNAAASKKAIEPNVAAPTKSPKVIDISKNKNPSVSPTKAQETRAPKAEQPKTPVQKSVAAKKVEVAPKAVEPAPKKTESAAKKVEPAPKKTEAANKVQPAPKKAEPAPKKTEAAPQKKEPSAKKVEAKKAPPKAPVLEPEPKGEPPPPEPKGEPSE